MKVSRLLTLIVAVPVGAVVVALSVANRRPVTLALDPFRPDSPAYSVSVPLFALVLGALGLGILFGGSASWWRQRRHRRAASQGRREVARLSGERDRLAADLAARVGDATPSGPALPAPGAPRRAA